MVSLIRSGPNLMESLPVRDQLLQRWDGKAKLPTRLRECEPIWAHARSDSQAGRRQATLEWNDERDKARGGRRGGVAVGRHEASILSTATSQGQTLRLHSNAPPPQKQLLIFIFRLPPRPPMVIRNEVGCRSTTQLNRTLRRRRRLDRLLTQAAAAAAA